ncbi:MAG: putative 4-phosphopantetheinyl transferase HetI [Gammaproteobacteria bacterium]|nr:putative 4-phosphopantetheinyl transferase HetI [Gammaproteobacteria bacterium]
MNQKAIKMSLITDMEPMITLDPEVLLALPASLVVEPHTVHVWAFTLTGSAALSEACRDVLSPAERQRADRFVFAHDRIRHTIAHGVLRHLLSRYSGIAPGALHFQATASGKPSLLCPAGAAAASLQFNLTHSEDRALLGVSDGRELGIDLERVRSNLEALDISRHYFFGAEREAIENALSVMRDRTFFRYWVAKEAVLKAQGVGLGFPLDRFCIHFHAGGDTAHIETLDPAVLERDWTVRMLPCEADWAAAVAVRGNDWRVKVENCKER